MYLMVLLLQKKAQSCENRDGRYFPQMFAQITKDPDHVFFNRIYR